MDSSSTVAPPGPSPPLGPSSCSGSSAAKKTELAPTTAQPAAAPHAPASESAPDTRTTAGPATAMLPGPGAAQRTPTKAAESAEWSTGQKDRSPSSGASRPLKVVVSPKGNTVAAAPVLVVSSALSSSTPLVRVSVRPAPKDAPTARVRPDGLSAEKLQPPPPLAPAPAQASSPSHVDPQKPRALSLSASASPSVADDDEFVFMLDHVHTTAEAIDRIHHLQKSSGSGAAETGAEGGRTPKTAGRHLAHLSTRSELPETMADFYACSNYIVSLVVSREAVFEDALSGFHSLVKREEAEVAAFQRKREELLQAKQERAKAFRLQQRAAFRTKREAAARESRASKEAARKSAEKPSKSTDAAAHATVDGILSLSSSSSSGGQAQPSAAGTAKDGPSAPQPKAADPQPAAEPQHSGKTTPEQEDTNVPASLMFLWRSRDEAALRAMTSPAPSHLSDTLHGAHSRTSSGMGPTHYDAEEGVSGTDTAIASPTNHTSVDFMLSGDEESLRERQYLTFLKEKQYARCRAPEVFRFSYPPELDLRPGGLSAPRFGSPVDPALQKRAAYNNPQNKIMKEWLYVWEQFSRDIHREVLLIEDASYNRAEDAIAAIQSYIEYSYDRARSRGLERLDKAKNKSAPNSAHSSRHGSKVKSSRSPVSTAVSPEDAKESTVPAREGAAPAASPASPPARVKAAPKQVSPDKPAAAPSEREKEKEGEKKKKGFFDSILHAGAVALKDVAIKAHDSLPAFMSEPLVAASGIDPSIVRATSHFPADPVMRGRKIYDAIREVVLAAQQSFMGFPYQLLCEQVGTERLALALEEYLEEEQEDRRQAAQLVSLTIPPPELMNVGDEAANAATEQGTNPLQQQLTSPIALPSPAVVASPFEAADAGKDISSSQGSNSALLGPSDGSPRSPGSHTTHPGSLSLRHSNSQHVDSIVSTPASPLMPPASPSPGSRVVRIYHSGGTDKRRHASTASSPASATASPQSAVPAAVETRTASAFAAPPPPAPPTAAHDETKEDALAALRLMEEKRREREKRLPLLVGEPRPEEFQALLDVIRAKVDVKNRRELKWLARHRPHREVCTPSSAALHQQHQQHPLYVGADSAGKSHEESAKVVVGGREGSAPSSLLTSPLPADPLVPAGLAASISGSSHSGRSPQCGDSLSSIDAAAAAAAGTPMSQHHNHRQQQRRRRLFRNDVDGSAYLLPVKLSSDAINDGDGAEKSTAREEGSPRHLHGMRIHLYFDPHRNAPVVCVNKVFRLFTMPGLHPFSASATTTAASRTPEESPIAAAARSGTEEPERGEDEKSLLLLIQIEFSLFLREEAEVRWRWYTV